MATKEIFLPVGREQIAISVLEPPKSQIAVLFLFGGSRKKSRERFFGWQRDLFNNGISSVSFDYTGTGQSSGNFHDSSLAKRIGESVIVFEWMSHLFTVHQEIAICGGSMGAYIALGLMSHFKAAVKNLILFCPAAYTKEAHDIRFGPQFQKVISQPNSWRNSPAFDWLQEFQGHLLLLLPQRDEIIPTDITQEFQRRTTNTSVVNKVIIKNASHELLASGSKNKAVREEIYRQSVIFLKRQ